MTARWVRRDVSPYLNVRAWPVPASAISYGPDVGNLYPGCPVDVRQTAGVWSRVWIEAQERYEYGRVQVDGWVLTRYLTDTPGGRVGALARVLGLARGLVRPRGSG